MKTQILSILAGILFLLSSCASVAKIEKDESVDFSKYHSFAWVKDSSDISDFPSDIQETNLQNAVNNELEKANFKLNEKKPDILLKHDLLVEDKIRESSTPVYSRSYTRPYYNPYTRRWSYIYYPGNLMGYDRRQSQVKEGTLTLSMIDAKTDKVVWQGRVTNEMNDAQITSKELERGVKTILKSFVKN